MDMLGIKALKERIAVLEKAVNLLTARIAALEAVAGLAGGPPAPSPRP